MTTALLPFNELQKQMFVALNGEISAAVYDNVPENVTKPWVARKGLDKATYDAVQNGLFAIKDPAILKELKISGFVPTSDDEYKLTREGMQIAERFENPRSGQ